MLKFPMNWQRSLQSKIKLNEPLKNYTTLKIGGPARFFVEPKNEADLKLLLKQVRRYRIPYLILGAGSNILVCDKGVKSAVISLSSGFRSLKVKGRVIEAGSGLRLAKLIDYAQKYGLSGIEFLSAIPGTVGGALVMNAGCWGKSVGELVESVKVMDSFGRIRVLEKKEIKFSYRKSGLEKYIILSVAFRLTVKNKAQIKKEISVYLEARHKSQDTSFPNAGCVFKNPAGESAGRLIDLCGLKGKKQGGFSVSLRHANFILNTGGGCASDMLKLMNLIKSKVKSKFKVLLEPEIKIWQ